MKNTLASWRWRAQRRIGLTNMLALLMLVMAVILAAWIPSLERENKSLLAHVQSTVNPGVPQVPSGTEASRVPVSKQLGDFVAAFPTTGQSADDLEAVFQSAERHGVRLTKGEYLLKQDINTPLIALHATFPIKADYRHIKDFTADVLKTLPHAAMEDLRMARNDAANPVLDAVVRFSLVYRRP